MFNSSFGTLRDIFDPDHIVSSPSSISDTLNSRQHFVGKMVKMHAKTRFLPFSSACMAVLGLDMPSTIYGMTSIDEIYIF